MNEAKNIFWGFAYVHADPFEKIAALSTKLAADGYQPCRYRIDQRISDPIVSSVDASILWIEFATAGERINKIDLRYAIKELGSPTYARHRLEPPAILPGYTIMENKL